MTPPSPGASVPKLCPWRFQPETAPFAPTVHSHTNPVEPPTLTNYAFHSNILDHPYSVSFMLSFSSSLP